MQEGFDIFHLKGDILSSVWSPNAFLYKIREPRYNQIKMGYHILKFLNIGQSSVLKSDVPFYLTYISAPLYFIEMGLNLKYASWCHIQKGICPRLLRCS